jgi:hypothetical protein
VGLNKKTNELTYQCRECQLASSRRKTKAKALAKARAMVRAERIKAKDKANHPSQLPVSIKPEPTSPTLAEFFRAEIAKGLEQAPDSLLIEVLVLVRSVK